MTCHGIVLETIGKTYTFNEIEKRKETIEEKTKSKNTNRKRKKLKKILQKTICNKRMKETNYCRPRPPAGEAADT